MERPALLPLLLLLLGLVARAAATGAEAQACEPANLAAKIVLFCAPNVPTAPACCESVFTSVDLGGGASVDLRGAGSCLHRVTAQPQFILAGLDSSHLLGLYAACGGHRSRGPHLAADGRGAHRELGSTSTASMGCGVSSFATQIKDYCGDGTATSLSVSCCEPVIASMDITGCLCHVLRSHHLTDSTSIMFEDMLVMYGRCGGIRNFTGITNCEDIMENHLSPPPPATVIQPQYLPSGNKESTPPSNPSADDSVPLEDLRVDLTTMMAAVIVLLVIVAVPIAKYLRKYSTQKTAAKQAAIEVAVETALLKSLPGAIGESVKETIKESVEAATKAAVKTLMEHRPAKKKRS